MWFKSSQIIYRRKFCEFLYYWNIGTFQCTYDENLWYTLFSGLTQSDLFKPAQSSPIVDEPEAAIRSVSMRDMGTEMTPIASQEPSRTGTPIIASSPTSSRTPTPQRTTEFSLSNIDSNKKEMSEEELQINTRQEIMDLGQRLGKTTIAAWASKEEKAAAHLTSSTTHKVVNIDMEARATDWQEAEKAKYLARYI